jgi:hypothetical protein
MPLLSCLSRTWSRIQGNLFPWLTEELGPLTETHKQVVTALEVAGVEAQHQPASTSNIIAGRYVVARPRCAPLRRYWLVERHHLGDEGFHVAYVRQPASSGDCAKVLGRVAGIIGLMIILREKLE